MDMYTWLMIYLSMLVEDSARHPPLCFPIAWEYSPHYATPIHVSRVHSIGLYAPMLVNSYRNE